MVVGDQRIRFAVVDCGHIGKRHAEMISRNPESQLVELIDVKGKTARKLINTTFLLFFVGGL